MSALENDHWVNIDGELYSDLTENQKTLADTPRFQLTLDLYRIAHSNGSETAPNQRALLNEELQIAYEQDMNRSFTC